MTRWIRNTLLLSLLLALFSVLLFPQAIFLKWVEWRISYFAMKNFGAHFSYEALEFEDSKIQVKKGKFSKEGHNCFEISIDKASFAPAIFNKESDGWHIQGMEVDIEKHEDFALENLLSCLSASSLQVSIERGELHLYDMRGQVPRFQKVLWRFQDEVLLFQPSLDHPALKLWIEKRGKKTTFRTTFVSTPLSPLIDIIYFFAPLPEASLVRAYSHGSLDGEMELEFQDKKCSLAKGEIKVFDLLGMSGTVFLNSDSPDMLLRADFGGLSSKIEPLIPEDFKKSFHKAFADDEIALSLLLKQKEKGLECEGSLAVIDASLKRNVLDFGCEMCGFDKMMGWFRGHDFSLEKFLTPFLFKGGEIALRGIIDLEGTFDKKCLMLHYNGEKIDLESPHFALHLNSLQKSGAFHCFDFSTLHHHGFLPLKNARYEQKNLGFTLKEASGGVYFENNQIAIKEIKSGWEELSFEGEVHIKTQKQNVDLTIEANSVTGSLLSAKQFLAHFTPSHFWQIPLVGDVTSGKKGVLFHFLFEPKKKAKVLEGHVTGTLCSRLDHIPIHLNRYESVFDYDFLANRLLFQEGVGELEIPCLHSLISFKTPEIMLSEFPDPCIRAEAEIMQGEKIVLTLEKDHTISILSDYVQLRAEQIGTHLLTEQNKQFKNITFLIPPEKILDMTELALQFFPMEDASFLMDLIAKLKKGEALEGTLSLEGLPKACHIKLALKDGSYHILGRDVEMKNISLDYAAPRLHLAADCFYQDRFYYLAIDSEGPEKNAGTLTVAEERTSPESVVIDWKKNNGESFSFEKIAGNFSGLSLDLVRKQKSHGEKISLQGHVGVNLAKAKRFFPEPLAKKLECYHVGDGYLLNGDFIFSINDPKDLVFFGELSGSNCAIGSVNITSLFAEVSYTPRSLEFKNLFVEHGGGKMSIERATLLQENLQWSVDIPKVKMTNVSLSQLRKEVPLKAKKRFLKPFFIQSFELKSLKGVLGDDLSFTGSGDLQFANLQRKTIFSHLLLIPSEITARIGLDLSLLVPARGIVRYEIKEGRIYLTKFKNMYSEGKRSRFYLAHEAPSFIDFDGNLNLKVKMKQYNLLMKVAELFVVTVKGDLSKPTYSFSNQVSDKDE